MMILVAGATGATGSLLVRKLLDRGAQVRVIVRSTARLPVEVPGHENLSATEASILDLSDTELLAHVAGCTAVVSCLGHNLNFRGVFGPPRRLVSDATRRLCRAIESSKPAAPVRFVLMNTAGNRNRGANERVSFGQKCILSLLRLLVPPHADNEDAAEYLRTNIGENHKLIEWAVVRPDSLTNEAEHTRVLVHPSPTRSAIFDPGRTSRINVAAFMAELVSNSETWNEWKGQMPVIYNMEADPG